LEKEWKDKQADAHVNSAKIQQCVPGFVNKRTENERGTLLPPGAERSKGKATDLGMGANRSGKGGGRRHGGKKSREVEITLGDGSAGREMKHEL